MQIAPYRLSELGSECIHPRVDVDLEDWGVIDKWMEEMLENVLKLEIPVATDYLQLSMPVEDTGVSRTRPFYAKMTVSLKIVFVALCLQILIQSTWSPSYSIYT